MPGPVAATGGLAGGRMRHYEFAQGVAAEALKAPWFR